LGVNYYERHIGDYIKDTVKLTMLEDGAYNRLIDQCYQTERPLPLDKREVYREARATSPAERRAVDYVLATYFTPTDDGFRQKRIESEIERLKGKLSEKSRKATAAANKRWSKQTHVESDADALPEDHADALPTDDASAMQTHSERNAHQTPDTRHQSPPSSPSKPLTGAAPPSGMQDEPAGGLNEPPEDAAKTTLPCPHLKILALWQEVLPAMPQHDPQQWHDTRRSHLQRRWRETATVKEWPSEEAGLEWLRRLFTYVGRSKFLTGKSDAKPGSRPFVIELEWLVRPSNWAKVIEGKYHTED
jgi:uncharacterized protein YdaU (DUF1376 family)